MKKLWLLRFLPLACALLVFFAFKTDNNRKTQPGYQFNYKPAAVKCFKSGIEYSIKSSCRVSPGFVCLASPCPAAPATAGFRATAVNCLVGGLLVAYGANCTVQPGSVCTANPCP